MELPERDDEINREGAEQELWRAALRLMGATPPGDELPRTEHDLRELLDRVRSKGEGMSVKPEIGDEPGALPRYCGDHCVWVSPGPADGLRLRAEYPWLRALVATLRSDGTLSEPEAQVGFGVPDEALTEQARADLASVQRSVREEEAEAAAELLEDELAERKRVELLAVAAAPRQDPEGLVVTTVELYSDRAWVNYLLSTPDLSAFSQEREPHDAHCAAAFPPLRLSDDLGTEYENVDLDSESAPGPWTRAGQAFAPAVPKAARRLLVASADRQVEIEVGSR